MLKLVIGLSVALAVACSQLQEAQAMSFNRSFNGVTLQNIRTYEIRSAYGWHGYAKSQSDFDEYARDVASSAGTGEIVLGGWLVINKARCYDADRPQKDATIPECDRERIESFESVRKLSLDELNSEARVRYVISGVISSFVTGLFLSPLFFFVFYPIASTAWHLGMKRFSKTVLTFVLAPFLWVLVRQGIPGAGEFFRSPWSGMATAPIWLFLSLFGVLWRGTEGRIINFIGSPENENLRPFMNAYEHVFYVFIVFMTGASLGFPTFGRSAIGHVATLISYAVIFLLPHILSSILKYFRTKEKSQL